MDNYVDLLNVLKNFFYKEKVSLINDPPPILSERKSLGSVPSNKKFIFISYSHYDFEAVYSDLKKLWGVNANYWYDREFIFSDTTENWEKTANSKIMDKNCVGVLFYVSKNSFVSQAVYHELLSCKQRLKSLKEGESFSYKIILLEGNSIFDIQNSCKLPENFSSQRLIDIHSLWGTENIHTRYELSGNHIFNIVQWFVKSNCINDLDFDLEQSVIVRKDYAIIGNSLISYYGSTDEFHLESDDRVSTITTKAFASTHLKKLIVPEGVTEIEDFAIIACSNLESIYIPSTVEKMGFFALSNFNYKKISISPENKHFKTDENGFVYRIQNGMPIALFASPNKNKVRILRIEDSVSSINDFAISCCDNLEEIVFSKQLKRIGYWSIKENKRLKKITLFSGIKYISPHAFTETCIEEVQFVGTKEEWQNYPKINQNDTLLSMFKNAHVKFVDLDITNS